MSWPTIPLGEICKPKQHKTIPSSELHDDGYVVYGANGPIGYYSDYTHNRTTIAVTCRGATCGTINIVPPKSYITGNAMALDDLDENRVDLNFLRYVLEHQGFASVINGAAQPQITRGPLLTYTIPLPPLEEQKRIAGILDQADALRRLRTRALDKLNTLGQAIFHEMFVKGNQPTGALSDILIETQIGPFGSLLHKSDYVSGGTCLINPMHINGGQIQPDPNFSISDEKLEELRRYILRPFDIIMGRRGEMGRCAVISENDPRLICGTGSMVLRVDRTKTTPEFLAFFLSTDTGRRQLENAASGVTMPNLNTKSLDAVSVPTPSFEKQEAFSEAIHGLEQQAIKSNRLHQKQETLFASLQHRAFRGEL